MPQANIPLCSNEQQATACKRIRVFLKAGAFVKCVSVEKSIEEEGKEKGEKGKREGKKAIACKNPFFSCKIEVLR